MRQVAHQRPRVKWCWYVEVKVAAAKVPCDADLRAPALHLFTVEDLGFT